MRSAAVSSVLLAAFFAVPSHAAQIFDCGGASVRIEVVARESRAWEDRAEAVVTLSREGVQTILRYRYVDFIGGQCFTKRDTEPLVVFQAVCGGSGCADLANWGVIEAQTLRVLTVPSDSNMDETRKLIGSKVLPKLDMMSVLHEARKQGIDVPE